MNPQVISVVGVFNLFAVLPAFGASTKPVVNFASPCLCSGCHHQDRWPAKTDPQRPPTDKSKITPITPSQMFAWPGVGTNSGLTRQSKRIASEQRWFALTGRVADVRVEGDGDLHVALVDVNGSKPGIVGAEVPPGKAWCPIRKVVFSWTNASFPLKYPTKSKLKVIGTHVVTVMGKAFYDVDHAPKSRSNERPKPFAAHYAVWEVHPVMVVTH